MNMVYLFDVSKTKVQNKVVIEESDSDSIIEFHYKSKNEDDYE